MSEIGWRADARNYFPHCYVFYMRAEPEMWKHQPFGDVAPIPYRATFDAGQYERLKDGFIPREMEDKWVVFFNEPELLFHRSWTGQACYRVKLQGDGRNYTVVSAECDSAVFKGDPEYHAQLLNFLICNLLLGEMTPFPRPKGISETLPGLLQHHISGTGYPERIVAKKPWWKFWS